MSPYYADELVALHQSEAGELLATIADGTVDLIATDPPYFRVKDEPWDRAWDTAEGFLAWMAGVVDEFRRVLKPSGSLYLFASPVMERRVADVVGARFRVLNVIRWQKKEGWHNKSKRETLRSFLSPWEAVIFAEQHVGFSVALRAVRLAAGLSTNDIGRLFPSDSGGPTGCVRNWELGLNTPTPEQWAAMMTVLPLLPPYEATVRPFTLRPSSQASDIWQFGTVAPYPGRHGCEKPIALMEHIITASSRPGDLVLDPFAGSGSTLLAARALGRRAIGGDASPHWTAYAAKRLSQSVLGSGVA